VLWIMQVGMVLDNPELCPPSKFKDRNPRFDESTHRAGFPSWPRR